MNKKSPKSLHSHGARSQIIHGLEFLKRDNPWPDFPYGEHAPFHLALDANNNAGRELILRELDKFDVKLMVEVGCFLGGSVIRWLDHKPDLTVIGVDSWDSNWAAKIEMMPPDPVMSRHVWHMPEEEVARIVWLLRKFGNYGVTMNNMRRYKSRFIPVRQRVPDALYYLAHRKIQPDAIYLDAGKDEEDLWIAHSLFPDALLWGDDWLWFDENGDAPMQIAVDTFCKVHGYEYEASKQTWVIHSKTPDAG